MKTRLTVGRQGATEAIAEQVRRAFEETDLIKIRLAVDDRAEADSLVSRIETLVPCHSVRRIGRVALFYRQMAEPGD